MEYTLGMGFYGTVYKKIPTIQVFVGDRLIDEYSPESINGYKTKDIVFNRDWWASRGKISRQGTRDITNKEYKDVIANLPKHFKLYTLNENVLKNQSTIEIKIKNSDTNYTNGFMTKSTLMNMSNIFLIPSKIFEYYLTRQKEPNEMYNKIKDIIPSCTDNWDNIPSARYNDSWFKGYPYPFKYFWNNETISNSLTYFIGGNGTLKFDIIYENNIIMFDYYKNQLIELLQNGWDELPAKYVCYGFPFCTDFFVLSHMLNSNK